MQPGGLEFRASHAQTLCKHPHHQIVLLLLGVPADRPKVKVVVVTVDSPCAHCQAELNVCFDAPGVGGSVEQPELHGALCEECMEVEGIMLSST